MARPSMKVAVEFDGPTHYLLGGASGRITPNGATSFKRRLLRILGWEVIVSPTSSGTRSAPPKRRGRPTISRLKTKFDRRALFISPRRQSHACNRHLST